MKRRAELDFPPATLIQVLRHRIRGGWGVKAFDDLDDTGWGGGGQNVEKPDDVILERSLRWTTFTFKVLNI